MATSSSSLKIRSASSFLPFTFPELFRVCGILPRPTAMPRIVIWISSASGSSTLNLSRSRPHGTSFLSLKYKLCGRKKALSEQNSLAPFSLPVAIFVCVCWGKQCRTYSGRDSLVPSTPEWTSADWTQLLSPWDQVYSQCWLLRNHLGPLTQWEDWPHSYPPHHQPKPKGLIYQITYFKKIWKKSIMVVMLTSIIQASLLPEANSRAGRSSSDSSESDSEFPSLWKWHFYHFYLKICTSWLEHCLTSKLGSTP